MDMIQVRRTAEHDSFIFEVVVREGKGETRHHVTMSQEMCERLTAGKHTPEHCVERLSGFYSTVSQRNRSSDASMRRRSCAISPSSNGRYHITFRNPDNSARFVRCDVHC